MNRFFAAAAMVAFTASTAANAAVTFEPESGTGFVGKGDIQVVFGWNNRQLHDHADTLVFRARSETITERTWVCTNSNNENTQSRLRTTTTAISGVAKAVARERNQITGFNLTGYEGDPVVEPLSTDGPPLNSCPSGPWSLTNPAGEPVVVSKTVTITVNGVAIN